MVWRASKWLCWAARNRDINTAHLEKFIHGIFFLASHVIQITQQQTNQKFSIKNQQMRIIFALASSALYPNEKYSWIYFIFTNSHRKIKRKLYAKKKLLAFITDLKIHWSPTGCHVSMDSRTWIIIYNKAETLLRELLSVIWSSEIFFLNLKWVSMKWCNN